MWYCSHHEPLYLFAEYKYLKSLPKKADTIVKAKLSSQQKTWLINRHNAGIEVAVILGSPEGGVLFRDPTEAAEGITKQIFTERMLPPKKIAQEIEKCLSAPTS